MKSENYLTNISQHQEILEKHGFCKTLLVRRLSIHIKHLMTEIFVRKTICVDNLLNILNIDLFTYMSYMTNHLRRIFHIDRDYAAPVESIIKEDGDRFYSFLGLTNPIVLLDFDGTTTSTNFEYHYKRLCESYNVQIVTANPTVTKEWFIKKEYPIPNKIWANRGKQKKIRCLFELIQKHPVLVFVDNEVEYLDYAYKMGIYTFHWSNNKINYFTLQK